MMVEMVNYIFDRLQSSADDVKSINKTLRKQVIFNNRLTVFAVIITAYTIATKIKLEELGKEIDGLKRKKGE